jgi:transglutaminase-like putative cysteine protease
MPVQTNASLLSTAGERCRCVLVLDLDSYGADELRVGLRQLRANIASSPVYDLWGNATAVAPPIRFDVLSVKTTGTAAAPGRDALLPTIVAALQRLNDPNTGATGHATHKPSVHPFKLPPGGVAQPTTLLFLLTDRSRPDSAALAALRQQLHAAEEHSGVSVYAIGGHALATGWLGRIVRRAPLTLRRTRLRGLFTWLAELLRAVAQGPGATAGPRAIPLPQITWAEPESGPKGHEVSLPARGTQTMQPSIQPPAISTPYHGSVGALAAALTRTARSDTERAYALYNWVAHNIAYDPNGITFGPRDYYCPSAVLKRGKSICEGYSRLYQGLAQAVGLKVELVRGIGRPGGTRIDSAEMVEDHVWNAVCLDGKWHLLDVTWGAGTLADGTGAFQPKYDAFWFMTAPGEFLYSHYPTDPRWQIAPTPISRNAFERLNTPYAHFFRLGFVLDTHRDYRIEGGARIKVSLGQTRAASVIAELTRKYQTLSGVAVEQSAGRVTVTADLPQPGEYTLQLFATDAPPVPGQPLVHESIIEYLLVRHA